MPKFMEHEDREEQDLVLLTEISVEENKDLFSQSPVASHASTKDVSFESDPDYDSHMAYSCEENADVLAAESVEQALEKLGSTYYLDVPEADSSTKANRFKLSRKQKLIGVGLLCLLITIAVVIGVVVLGVKSGKRGQSAALGTNSAPSLAPVDTSSAPNPVPPASFVGVASRLFDSPDDYPRSPEDPSYQAVTFLVNEIISSGLEVDNTRLSQRYALAIVFFSLGGPSWTDSLGFLSEAHECDWNQVDNSLIKGAVCTNNDGRVDYLSLPNNNLTGTIHEDIRLLPEVFYLDFSFNGIKGNLPGGFGSLVKLEYLSLGSNSLTGAITDSVVSSWKKMTYLSIEQNQLTGSLDTLCALNTDPVLRADCLGQLREVECECCDVCCSPENQCE